MGRIKTQLIKKAAENLVKTYGSKLTANFDENKAFLKPNIVISSKKLKNAIIGYATRLIRMNKLE